MNSSTQETVDRVNQLIATLPADDAFPADGFGSVKSNYRKLESMKSGLNDIKTQSDGDIKCTSLDLIAYRRILMTFVFRAIDKVLEQLEILIALRTASEPTPQGTRSLH